MKVIDAIQTVLQEAGEPLHVRDIVKRLVDSGRYSSEVQNPLHAIRSRILASMKARGDQSPFERVESGVYALKGTIASVAGESAEVTVMDTQMRTPVWVDELEGVDDGLGSFGADYPIDTLWIRSENRTVHDVVRRIDKGDFIMNPDFQRDFIWSETKQSKLIESVMMRIPLPVLYLAEDKRGRSIVVDGLQRLATFHRFVHNEFKLRLPEQSELHGMKFEDLSPKLQNRIEDCNLIIYVIDANAPEQARLDIFDRVNSGEALTRQQMRNCLFIGEATRFLREQANTELFLEATGNGLNRKTMRDREFVNRFCAFRILDLNEYRDMDEFLANALMKMNHDPELLSNLSGQFKTSLTNNFYLFDKNAFRRPKPEGEGRSVLNAALWDVMSTCMAVYSEEKVRSHAGSFKTAFQDLLDEEEFVDVITKSTSNAKQVKRRFSMARKKFAEVFDAQPD